jgi:ParB/RepB/Spo0J family partition protein
MRLLIPSSTKRSAKQNAESIRHHGLIQPITVRPNSEGFELIAGARRYRAAQLAELFSIPARIAAYANGMTDDRIKCALEDDYLSRDTSPSKRTAYIRRTMEKARRWAQR